MAKRAKTYEECLREWQSPWQSPGRMQKAEMPDLDFKKLAEGIVRMALTTVSKAAKSAVDEVETRIAARIDRNPVTVTRAIAMREVFEADPALYERYRKEVTVGRDGQVTDQNPSAHNVGIGKSAGGSIDAEIEGRVDGLLAKSANLSRAQARHMVFERDPELYEKWRRETYA